MSLLVGRRSIHSRIMELSHAVQQEDSVRSGFRDMLPVFSTAMMIGSSAMYAPVNDCQADAAPSHGCMAAAKTASTRLNACLGLPDHLCPAGQFRQSSARSGRSSQETMIRHDKAIIHHKIACSGEHQGLAEKRLQVHIRLITEQVDS